jgi:MFS family permease
VSDPMSQARRAPGRRASGWRRLFGYPGVTSVVLVGAVARLPTGMFGLAVVLGVAASRSYAIAGAVVAGYSVALAVAAPLRARAVDRHGARRAIALTSLVQGACCAALAACLSAHVATMIVAVLAVGCGLSAPPVTPALRALWSALFDADPAARTAASSMESMVVDLSYIAGPGLVSVLILLGSAPIALAGVAALRVGSGAGLASLTMLSPPRTPATASRAHRGSVLRNHAVLALIPVALLAFGSISAIEVAVSALAQRHGHPAAAGALIAALSVGGVAGGLLRGHLAHRARRASTHQLLAALAVLTIAWATPAIVTSLPALAAVLLAAGLAMNPMISLHYDLLADYVPSEHRTEAFGWLNAANAAGAAVGSALAGALSTRSPAGGFATAAAMTAAAALITLIATPWLTAKRARNA